MSNAGSAVPHARRPGQKLRSALQESLRLPPHDRAPEVFAGASSENERTHRLVETFFCAYERGADGITAGRRERNDVPALDESMEALDNTFDAIVAEALGPQRADNSSVASLKALTDLEVWRTLVSRAQRPSRRWTKRAQGRALARATTGTLTGAVRASAAQATTRRRSDQSEHATQASSGVTEPLLIR